LKKVSILLFIQGIYTLITALWPLVHISSFLAVTGYKEDLWLVKTVAAILLAVAACFLAACRSVDKNIPVYVLAITSAIALATIDFYYSVNDVISNVYQADGVLQILFLISWLLILTSMYRQKRFTSGAKA
jgi:hypothetical protein